MENETPLADPPTDGITALRFSPDGAALLASSWDATLRLYDLKANALRMPPLALPCPLLDCDFVGGDGTTAASGGLDGAVRLHDLSASVTSPPKVLGSHESAVRCVRPCPGLGPNSLVSGSWDKTLKLWDVRSATPCTGTYAQPDKILSLCAGVTPGAAVANGDPPLLVVATQGRHIALLDLRFPAEPMQRRESSLKCQTRSVALMAGSESFILGSVEGRVAVEYIDPSPEAQQKRYAFKCHRAAVGGVDTAFPVNALAVHPGYGTFATGGADGHVHLWDGAKKKRICSLRRYPTSVACMAFSPNGSDLAIAASYTWEMGEQAHPPDAIFVRKVSGSEVKPKASKAA